MGNNEIKEIIQLGCSYTNGQEFYEEIAPMNGGMLRRLGIRGKAPLHKNYEKTYMYNSVSPSEEEYLKDMIDFIKPLLVSGVMQNLNLAAL